MRYLLYISTLCILLCESCKNKTSDSYEVTYSHSTYVPHNTPITATINSTESAFDSVMFTIDNHSFTFPYTNSHIYTIPTKAITLGNKNILCKIYDNGNAYTKSKTLHVSSDIVPEYVSYRIKQTFPHDIEAYTQGLELYNSFLYESTGLYGKSSLRKINISTGVVQKQIDIEKDYFAEGLTILHGRIYQLTWKENSGFIYDAESFRQIGTFSYPTEGWGLCNDGKHLILSDGSEFLYFYNPENFTLVKRIAVYEQSAPLTKLNELEYVDGAIYANIYTTNFIAKIDAETGKVIQKINMSNLLPTQMHHKDIDVLNGIAYNPLSQTFYVTGKNWPKIFEVTFSTPEI